MAHLIRTSVTKDGLVRISCVWCGLYAQTGSAGRTVGGVVAELRPNFFLDRKCGPLLGPVLRLLRLVG